MFFSSSVLSFYLRSEYLKKIEKQVCPQPIACNVYNAHSFMLIYFQIMGWYIYIYGKKTISVHLHTTQHSFDVKIQKSSMSYIFIFDSKNEILFRHSVDEILLDMMKINMETGYAICKFEVILKNVCYL